jgi:pyridoxamine 5'-phosphate oxidase
MADPDRLRPILSERKVHPDPLEQFRVWLEEAQKAQPLHPDAMTLATATPDGKPSARMVLLRGFDHRGFVFHTNYGSRKAREMLANSQAALVFYWSILDRQVRVEGKVERISPEESDAYFQTRPRGSQLGAWASDQSAVLRSREALDQHMLELEAKYQGQEVPRPPFWGGFRVVPESIEFWQGQLNRLHDRLRYRKNADGSWILERLSP